MSYGYKLETEENMLKSLELAKQHEKRLEKKIVKVYINFFIDKDN